MHGVSRCARMRTRACVRACVCVLVRACTRVGAHAYVCVRACVRVRARVCLRVRARVCGFRERCMAHEAFVGACSFRRCTHAPTASRRAMRCDAPCTPLSILRGRQRRMCGVRPLAKCTHAPPHVLMVNACWRFRRVWCILRVRRWHTRAHEKRFASLCSRNRTLSA